VSQETINPYWAVRKWKKAMVQFPSIKGEEEVYFQHLSGIEQQIAYMASKYDQISGEDVDLALAVCGLNVVAQLEGRERPEFVGLPLEVAGLVNRCMATFDPTYNQEAAEAAKLLWQDPEDEQVHYRTMGSVLRRLSDSCQLWTKKGGRKGYIRFISSFLREANMMSDNGRIYFTIGGKHIPPGEGFRINS
jgi:hypothetical protein